MSQDLRLGEINGHIVGRVIKEAVRRAMVAIKRERLIFESQVKRGYSGEMDDVLTSADKKAQEIYVRTLRECFPRCGIIAEENFSVPAEEGYPYFTVDPLDGTKAYTRRQSHGVGTMISLVHNKEVICAYIGDINTNEVYGYRPGSHRVFRISDLDDFEELSYRVGLKSGESHALLRDPAHLYSLLSRRFLDEHIKNYSVDGGSIGIWMARLWKCEVAAVLLLPGNETPWDSSPVIGLSLKLGYAFLRPNKEGTRWESYIPALSQEVFRREHDTLVVHGSELKKILYGQNV